MLKGVKRMQEHLFKKCPIFIKTYKNNVKNVKNIMKNVKNRFMNDNVKSISYF